MHKGRLATRITKIFSVCCLASGLCLSSVQAQGIKSVKSLLVAKDSVPNALKPFASWSASAEALSDSIVSLARRQMGVRYRRGASSPKRGFDCSGLVAYVMSHFDIRLPRTSSEQALVGQPLARDIGVLRPGDLLTFGHGDRISHVGIYVGGGHYVNASSGSRKVKEGSLVEAMLTGWWKGARRVVALADSGTAGSSRN